MVTKVSVLDERFAEVGSLFCAFAEEAGYSGQLAVFWQGEPVVDLASGVLADSALTGVFSVTKGISAIVLATLIDSGVLDLDAPVADFWPEFAAAGKDAVTVRQLLSHQAGLPAFAQRIPLVELIGDSQAGAARLAGQAPLWRPGSAFGYHALTIGTLMEEVVRRLTGESLQKRYERHIRADRHLDVFLGLPSADEERYVPLADMRPSPEQQAEIDQRPPADPLAELVFDNVEASTALDDDGITSNNPIARQAGQAAIGAVASAAGLAALYAETLRSGTRALASPEVFAAMAQQHSWGVDRVLDCPNSFGVVFMLPQPRMPFAGVGAFGHDGGGGALAFADPGTQLAFGYIPHPMQYPGGADRRALALARAARECARARP